MNKFSIVTDTATIAIFDLASLEHRIHDDSDWWTCELFPELQKELKQNNLYLINTKFDGQFEVAIVNEPSQSNYSKLKCRSRKLFIVCGEEIPSEGLTPQCLRGGTEITVESSIVNVAHFTRGPSVAIHIWT